MHFKIPVCSQLLVLIYGTLILWNPRSCSTCQCPCRGWAVALKEQSVFSPWALSGPWGHLQVMQQQSSAPSQHFWPLFTLLTQGQTPLHTEQVRSDCKAHWMRIEFTVPVFSIKELEGLAAIHAALGLWEDVFQPSRAIQFGKTRSSPIPKCWNFILSSHFPHPAQNLWYPRVQLPV